MEKMETCISFRTNRRKLCLFYLLFSVVTTFSNFQATYPLISPEVLEIFTPNSAQNSEKI